MKGKRMLAMTLCCMCCMYGNGVLAADAEKENKASWNNSIADIDSVFFGDSGYWSEEAEDSDSGYWSEEIEDSDSGDSKASNGKVLVAEPMEETGTEFRDTSEKAYIQDLVQYCNGTLSYDPLSTSENYNVRKFNGSAEDYEVVKAYIDELCSGNLQLVKTYEETYDDVFFSFGLDYVGLKNITDTVIVNYTEEYCNVNLYGIIERDRLTVSVWTPMEMELVDMGKRYGGARESVGYSGSSIGAGLYKLSDGSFETTDGRLKTASESACVLRDGAVCPASAEFSRNHDLSRDELWVRGFYRDEAVFFCTPAGRLMTGDIYTIRDVMREESWMRNKRMSRESDFTGYTWNLFLGTVHDGDYITPVNSELNEYENLTVRVMYWEPDAEAVYYISAEYDTAPYTLEILAAVSLAGADEDKGSVDGEYTIKTGETLELGCSREYHPNYELFRWKVTEGAELVSLDSDISSSCHVKALGSGTVRIQVTYEYGTDEPDVLTGIKRNTDHSRTQEFLINIQ